MKRIAFTILFFGLVNLILAQQEGKFRTGLDVGFSSGSASEGEGGYLVGIEPKYNLKGNLNVGIRFEAAGFMKSLRHQDGKIEDSDTMEMQTYSFMGTSDYYFHKEGGSSFAPFIGGGIGFYNVDNIYTPAEELIGNETVTRQSVFGGMVRGGFEWGKFRLTAQYSIIPKTDYEDKMSVVVGKTKNSYFGMDFGFYLGGGKWRK